MEFNFMVYLILLMVFSCVQGRVKYCYVCRSRGSLGDCGDPFTWNMTSVNELKGVEASPCPSGWCGKSIEGKEGDPLIATERMCLQRPPTDQEERCSETFYENKREPLFMCFCKGHLCNYGSRLVSTSFMKILLPLLAGYMVGNLNLLWR